MQNKSATEYLGHCNGSHMIVSLLNNFTVHKIHLHIRWHSKLIGRMLVAYL